MHARRTPTTARRPASRTAPGADSKGGSGSTPDADAIELLTQDHVEVKALFAAYAELVESKASDEDKLQTALEICTLLTVHVIAEEELFYPAARAAMGEDEDLVDEAEVEHDGVKELIEQIEAAANVDEHFDAKVKVLGEYVEHHVKEEEAEMFPKVRQAGTAPAALGREIAERKQMLLAQLQDDEADA